MSNKSYPAASREEQLLVLRHQPTTLRRCLGCAQWMRSTGPDHRLCNECTETAYARHRRVGSRLKR
jgi:hypothetical protein